MSMPPSEARRLTIPEALFYLASEEEMKRSCRRMNKISHFGREVSREEIVQAHRDHMTKLRKHFTGSEELTAD